MAKSDRLAAALFIFTSPALHVGIRLNSAVGIEKPAANCDEVKFHRKTSQDIIDGEAGEDWKMCATANDAPDQCENIQDENGALMCQHVEKFQFMTHIWISILDRLAIQACVPCHPGASVPSGTTKVSKAASLKRRHTTAIPPHQEVHDKVVDAESLGGKRGINGSDATVDKQKVDEQHPTEISLQDEMTQKALPHQDADDVARSQTVKPLPTSYDWFSIDVRVVDQLGMPVVDAEVKTFEDKKMKKDLDSSRTNEGGMTIIKVKDTCTIEVRKEDSIKQYTVWKWTGPFGDLCSNSQERCMYQAILMESF